MRSSAVASKMVTTHGGMRRILKKPLPPVEFLRKAIDSNVLSPERRGWRVGSDIRRLDPEMRDVVHAYPKEYEILTLNPPAPFEPKISKKDRQREAKFERDAAKAKFRKARLQAALDGIELTAEDFKNFASKSGGGKRSKNGGSDRLVLSYLRRHDEKVAARSAAARAEQSAVMAANAEEQRRYAHLLGIPMQDEVDGSTTMGRKATVLAHAYQFAMKQYDVLKEHEGMTEEQSVRVVEELLAKEKRTRREETRDKVTRAQNWRRSNKQKHKHQSTQDSALTSTLDANATHTSLPLVPSSTPPPVPPFSVPSILHGDALAIKAMQMWGRRLAAVPYVRWTVGAATALDHWIACDVLKLSELEWQDLLRAGAGAQAEHDTDLGHGGYVRSMARDLLAVRTALFPETVIPTDGKDDDALEAADRALTDAAINQLDGESPDGRDETERSIDELLASLGSLGDDDDPILNFGDKSDEGAQHDTETTDRMVLSMVQKLQDWRAKNDDVPYDSWTDQEKDKFNQWLEEYIHLATSDSDGAVDIQATRDALLSQSSTTSEQNDAFWSRIQDETQAEIFLASLHSDAKNRRDFPKNDAKISMVLSSSSKRQEALDAFLKLPYEEQLRRLVDLGTLRPLLDEYATESSRLEFLVRYEAFLLEGIPMEHLVPDPKGPITEDDLPAHIVLEIDPDKNERYSIQTIPYGTDEFGTSRNERARALFRLWIEHKVGRATYEEKMFKLGKLGLEAKDFPTE